MKADTGLSVAEALQRLRARFALAKLETPALDARLLVMAAAGLAHEQLISAPERLLNADETVRLEEMAVRREAGEPVSRIVGWREFYGRRFGLSPATLDPRPDTETLVDLVLGLARSGRFAGRDLRLLDLGTGSGAIAITLAAELARVNVLGSDISPGAIARAGANARALGVDGRAVFAAGDWFEAVTGRFDIIVSNPPYIADRHIDGLAREVAKFDPRAALAGGRDGLCAYRAIFAGARCCLSPGGVVAVETGCGQAAQVRAIARNRGFLPLAGPFAVACDLAGIERALAFELTQ